MTPTQAKLFISLMLNVFEAQLKSPAVQQVINDKSKVFDLLFIESSVRPALSFAYRYNVPVIEFSSLGGVYDTFVGTGAPTNVLVYPLPFRKRIYNLTLWEKISELYKEHNIEKVLEQHVEVENKVVREVFGSKVPDLRELKKNVALEFLNVHPLWDFNRPVPPNIIYLGGIHHKPQKELPKV